MLLAMPRRAVRALLFFCATFSPFCLAAFGDDVSIDPEIINVKALTLVPPAPVGGNTSLLLPRPHLPLHTSENDPGGAHVLLGDIPFKATRNIQTDSLWERVRASFAMRDLPTPLVRDWENWYASRQDYFARMVANSERYLFHIVEEVEKRGMPSEIALLPMIESAFNPTAYSTAHASGIWQFIPSTGRSYGLKQNWWQDERRDVLAATRAALDYLEKLYEMFNSWELALASYNWGEGAVQGAMRRNEARGMPTDYLSLDIPAETRNYIPKLMAVKNLIARPNDYGLRLAEIANRPYFAVVQTDRHIDIRLAAKLAEIPVEDFKALNPSHNRPVIRADVTQPILLPADRAELFQAKLQAHAGALTSWQPYTLGRDDRLDQVAQRFGIDVGKLREVNSIPVRFRSLVGMTILVPSQGSQSAGDLSQAGLAQTSTSAEPVVAATPVKHVVRAGETLAGIAQRYRMSVAQLTTRNGIRDGKILAGQTLTIGEALARTAQTVQPAQAQTPTRIAQAPAEPVVQSKNARPRKNSAPPAAKAQAGRAQVAYNNR